MNTLPPLPRFHFAWLLDARRDLVFYIGSALVGWLYLAVVCYAIVSLDNPLEDAFATLDIGPFALALTLDFLVVVSWAYILDAPHVWVTLARTLCDPEEWRTRPRALLNSFFFFLIGPLLILSPYLIGALTAPFDYALSEETMALGAVLFFVFFRLWAYYHVVRQHWGFFGLYKRKADDFTHHRLDTWFFNLTMYAPLVLFLTSPFYLDTPGFTNLGLHAPIFADWSIATVVHPLTWVVYAASVCLYLIYQIRIWRQKGTINASKLLYMALIVPLHLAAFSHPVTAVFIVPLVTVGHNIQYLCIVYIYGRKKYSSTAAPQFRWTRMLFANLGLYMLAGLFFTFLLYRGPWIDWLESFTGLRLDAVLFNCLGMMAGVRDPAALGLGQQIFAAALLGFAMQHYYLDAKIWRISRDKNVRRHLDV
jgi:hypothetical protein